MQWITLLNKCEKEKILVVQECYCQTLWKQSFLWKQRTFYSVPWNFPSFDPRGKGKLLCNHHILKVILLYVGWLITNNFISEKMTQILYFTFSERWFTYLIHVLLAKVVGNRKCKKNPRLGLDLILKSCSYIQNSETKQTVLKYWHFIFEIYQLSITAL